MPFRIRKRWLFGILLVLLCIVLSFNKVIITTIFPGQQVASLKKVDAPSWIDEQYITSPSLARSGKSLTAIRDVVIHYVGNPGTTAQQNRDYFNTPTTTVSSHFIIGLDGEIIQTMPLHEMSYATNWRNNDTISIEVTHPDASGKFTEASYDALVRLTAWLLHSANLSSDNVIRHYDVTGKLCPLYYVENEDAWLQLKADIHTAYEAI